MSDASSEFAKLALLNDQINQFCKERDWDKFHSPKEMAIGIVTEGAELLDIFRFKSDEQAQAILNDPSKRERVADELADVLYFVMRFADQTGISLPQALEEKLKKNIQKYPIEKSRGNNRKYNEE